MSVFLLGAGLGVLIVLLLATMAATVLSGRISRAEETKNASHRE